ncbi:MAG: hypothetical protein P8X73_07160, partial [Ignavibacteriaceae bacterium]
KIKYGLKDTRDWKLNEARFKARKTNLQEFVRLYAYRPFDERFICYSTDLIDRGTSRIELMKNLFSNNLALITSRQLSTFDFQHILITHLVTDMCLISLQTKETSYVFPLFLYSEDGTKIPNLKKEIVEEIEKTVGKVTPEDILDYIYAVLHSPSYREKYKEFLKIDFPRVPYPKDKDTFKKLVKLGTELRSIHLLESQKVNQYITTYPVAGNNEVEKIRFDSAQRDAGKVYINKEQYFGKVPEIAWNFYIGGYQPAQKWLKDRKGRTLTNSHIEHYQKIIVALTETDRIMKEIV